LAKAYDEGQDIVKKVADGLKYLVLEYDSQKKDQRTKNVLQILADVAQDLE
jgi:hypothetical protein